MTLLEDIQNSAIDGQSDLGALLRKCKVLAARLDSKPLEDWLIWESEGYPEDVEVPDYRRWGVGLRGHFSGPFGSGMRNALIPSMSVPKHLRNAVTEHECRTSVAVIEAALTNAAAKGESILQRNFADLARILGGTVISNMYCVAVWGEFGVSAYHQVLNAVRNRVLDFALQLWKENPAAGELSDDTGAPSKERVTQIINTTVYGGNTSVIGTANASTLNLNVSKGDWGELEAALRSRGVDDSDLSKLADAIKQDGEQASRDRVGNKVAGWIGAMVSKAASGGWDVGTDVAGQVLGAAIKGYYGFDR